MRPRVSITVLTSAYALGLLWSFPEWPAIAGMCAAGVVMCLVLFIYGALQGWA